MIHPAFNVEALSGPAMRGGHPEKEGDQRGHGFPTANVWLLLFLKLPQGL
jgi:hypothetical protein